MRISLKNAKVLLQDTNIVIVYDERVSVKHLNTIVALLLKMGRTCDIYFLKYGMLSRVATTLQITEFVKTAYQHETPLINTLYKVQAATEITEVKPKQLCIVLTAGHPTNDYGFEDMSTLKNWLKHRDYLQQTWFTFVVCTPEDSVSRSYRRLAYHPYSKSGVPNVSVVDLLNSIYLYDGDQDKLEAFWLETIIESFTKGSVTQVDTDCCCCC
jgi:hypothetical protein